MQTEDFELETSVVIDDVHFCDIPPFDPIFSNDLIVLETKSQTNETLQFDNGFNYSFLSTECSDLDTAFETYLSDTLDLENFTQYASEQCFTPDPEEESSASNSSLELEENQTPIDVVTVPLFTRASAKQFQVYYVVEQNMYQCPYSSCRKLYAKPSNLKSHLRRHVGEKPFECSWSGCMWKFSRSDELARHTRSHSGVKPYPCTECGKRFTRSDHLNKHGKVHRRRAVLGAAKFKKRSR